MHLSVPWTDVRPISMLREIVNHSGFGMNSRKENKYRKPINDKLLIGSRDGAGRVDVTVLDIHRFESRHKPSIIIERIVNEERIFPSRENSFGGDKSFFSFFFSFFFLRHLRRDCLPGILAKNTLYTMILFQALKRGSSVTEPGLGVTVSVLYRIRCFMECNLFISKLYIEEIMTLIFQSFEIIVAWRWYTMEENSEFSPSKIYPY